MGGDDVWIVNAASAAAAADACALGRGGELENRCQCRVCRRRD